MVKQLLRDPLLLSMFALTLLGSVLFAVFDGEAPRQVQVYWGVQVPLDAALGYGAWRLRSLAAARYRRFWSLIAVGGASFTVGDSFQFLTVLLNSQTGTREGGTVQSVLFTIGMSSNLLGCLSFPQGLHSAREKLVFWFDAATVLVGGGVMAWCFAVNPIDPDLDRVTVSITAALVIVAAFSASKLALSPRPPMSRTAAWPMVAAPMVQGVSTFLPGISDRVSGFVLALMPSLLIAVGPRIQEIIVRIDGGEARPKRRPYSLLPYTMIALTFLVFFAVLPERVSPQLWGATTGVVVITALVAGRQLIAFQDNIVLIRRLDDALTNLTGKEVLLRRQATHDALTDLVNRVRFQEEMARVLATGDPDERHTALLVDLDDFKTVNDTMGHAAGDALLIAVAQRLRAAVREGDVVARLGGDEFAVLLPGADGAVAGRIADDILRRIAADIHVQQHTVDARASIGIAVARPGDDPSVLLSNADIAMYEAKHRGKSTWVRYSEEMGARITAEADMIRDLAVATDAGQFALVYQPIVRLDDLTTTGVEALIRWNHPVRGLVSPVEFIPLAERSGHIVEIGRWALAEACRQAAAWRAQFPDAAAMTVGVNVAGRQLRTDTFVDEVIQVLADTGLPAECLCIEVTETAVLDDQKSHVAMLRLRELGVRLALDDFGTAASSLGLLLTCPVTTLKLDRSFVESIATVGRQAAVAAAVGQIAGALSFSSVAEGIETDEHRIMLQGLGYEYGQGYLFSRPLPPAEMTRVWAATPQKLNAS